MGRVRKDLVGVQVVELQGIRYAILPERLLHDICRRAGIKASAAPGWAQELSDDTGTVEHLDGKKLALRLAARRERLGLTQTELAGRAGIRVETLNRLERGRTTPDFSTIRKLVEALKQAESRPS